MTAALVIGVLTVIALAKPTSSSADPSLDATESEFLALINAYRQQNGLDTLVTNVDLAEAADWYTNDMATKNYFGDSVFCGKLKPPKPAHCDWYGGMPQHRVSAFGYGPASIGENAAAGFSSAQAVFDAWKQSSAHNNNMLRSYWKAIGIARSCKQGTTFGCYWVTDFGTVDSPPKPNLPYPDVLFTPTPTPSPPTPTATASPTPSPTPVPLGLTWEDLTCDGLFLPQDALAVIMNDAGIEGSGPAGSPSCPELGDTVTVDGVQRMWGDVDCSGAINAVDGVMLLLWMIDIPSEAADPLCPHLGSAL